MTLTREQVLEMGAGREMDRLVAETVMGWTSVKENDVVPDESWDLIGKHSKYADSIGWWYVKDYSTDISAAWEVVEKLDQEVTVKKYDAVGGTRYWCKIGEILEVAETAPLAICRVALLTTIGEGTE